MKIKFLKTVTADVETKHGEFYDRAYPRWTEVRVEGVYPYGNFATIKLEDGDILHGVPLNAFEKLQETKRTVTL